jgi:hypothetical protein
MLSDRVQVPNDHGLYCRCCGKWGQLAIFLVVLMASVIRAVGEFLDGPGGFPQ